MNCWGKVPVELMTNMFRRLIRRCMPLALLTLVAGCSSNATCPGTMQRLDALLLWRTPPDLGPAFYDKAYYADTTPTQETTEALQAVARQSATDTQHP